MSSLLLSLSLSLLSFACASLHSVSFPLCVRGLLNPFLVYVPRPLRRAPAASSSLVEPQQNFSYQLRYSSSQLTLIMSRAFARNWLAWGSCTPTCILLKNSVTSRLLHNRLHTENISPLHRSIMLTTLFILQVLPLVNIISDVFPTTGKPHRHSVALSRFGFPVICQRLRDSALRFHDGNDLDHEIETVTTIHEDFHLCPASVGTPFTSRRRKNYDTYKVILPAVHA